MSSGRRLTFLLKANPISRKAWGIRAVGTLVLIWMAVTLFLYFAVHSPLRELIASLFHLESRGCFFCTYQITIGIVMSSLSAFFLIITSLLAGWITTEHLDLLPYEKIVSFVIISLAFLVVPAALLGEFSALLGKGYLQPPYGPLIVSIPAICAVSYGFLKGWRPYFPTLKIERQSFIIAGMTVICIVILLSSIMISLVHPPSGYDSLGYHGPMATFLWKDGNLVSYLDRSPSYWALAHPGTAELWIGLLFIAGGETLGKLGQLPFILLGCAAIYAFTRRLGLQRGASSLAAISYMLIPIVIVQAGLLLNDLVGAGLLMATFVLASAPLEEWNVHRCALIGLGLGLVITTKLAFLPAAAFLGLYVAFFLLTGRRLSTGRKVILRLILMAALFFITIAPWWLRNTIRYGNPIFPVSLPFIGRGISFSSSQNADLAFVPRSIAWLIYPFIEIHDDQSGFGVLFLVFSIIGFIYALKKAHQRPLILFTLLSVVLSLSWWFFSEHFPRFLLPVIGLACAFIPWSIQSIPKSQRRFGYALLIVAAVFSSFVTYHQALLPFARQPLTRVEFYNQVWGVDPAAQSLPETEGILLQTGYAPNLSEYAAYYPLLGNSLQRLVIPADRESNTASIISLMKKNNIQYAYVAANPENLSLVKSLFNSPDFELVTSSMVVKGSPTGPRRSLIRPAMEGEEEMATWRYLFRLRQ